jgi:hypothetical protein
MGRINQNKEDDDDNIGHYDNNKPSGLADFPSFICLYSLVPIFDLF